jgi:hypothetical protein
MGMLKTNPQITGQFCVPKSSIETPGHKLVIRDNPVKYGTYTNRNYNVPSHTALPFNFFVKKIVYGFVTAQLLTRCHYVTFFLFPMKKSFLRGSCSKAMGG